MRLDCLDIALASRSRAQDRLLRFESSVVYVPRVCPFSSSPFLCTISAPQQYRHDEPREADPEREAHRRGDRKAQQ